MSKIYNSTKPNGRGGSSGENSAARRSNGFQGHGSNTKNKQTPFRLIRAANRKIRLYQVLKTYNIKIPKNYKYQVWSSTITCPLPSHKAGRERTPSFGYNFIEDRFWCLGCKKGGRAVEFISEMEGRKRNAVAQSILDHYSDSDYLDEPTEEEEPEVESIIFSISKDFRDFYKKNKNYPDKISSLEKIIWWFDSYIAIRVGAKNECKSSNIDVEELGIRVQKAKDLLKEIDR